MEQKQKKFVKLNNGSGKPVANSKEQPGVIKNKKRPEKEQNCVVQNKTQNAKENIEPKKRKSVKQLLNEDKEEIDIEPQQEKRIKTGKKNQTEEVQLTNKERRVARVLQNAAAEENGYKKSNAGKQRNDRDYSGQKQSKEKVVQTKEEEEQDNDLILRLKKDLSFLITKKNSKSIKQKKVIALFDTIEGFIFKISLSKVGGRTLQVLMLKFADDVTRAKIFEKLLSNESLFGELIKSNYGHYVGITMIRTMPNQFKKSFFNQLLKGVFQFVVHQQASQVLDRFLIKGSSPAQINQIKQVFTLKSQGESVDQELIENLAVKVIEKELHNNILALHTLSLALPIMVPVEREKIVNYFQALDNHNYLRLREGAQFFCQLINVSDTKVRKTIVKVVGANIIENLLEQGSFYYVGILKLLHSVDDTVITFKFILRLIAQNFEQVLENKGGYSIISSLLIPKHNELQQFETKNSLKNLYSKKDDTSRALELCLQIIDPLILALDKYDTEKLLKSVGFSRFTAGVCRFIVQQQIAGGVHLIERVIVNLLDEETAKGQSSDWILGHPDSQRLAKSLILLAVEENQEPFSGILTKYLGNLTNLLIKYSSQTLKSKAIYLLIPLLESTDQKIKIVKHLQKTKLRQQDCMNEASFGILQQHVQN